MKLIKDKEIGKVYGRLKIVKFVEPYRTPKKGILYKMVECKCKCGKIKQVRLSSLRSGLTTSCGCIRIKHNKIGTVEYKIWGRMSSSHKGDVSERWLSFENFLKDMGERPDNRYRLQRINIDKPFGKNNCRWRKLNIE